MVTVGMIMAVGWGTRVPVGGTSSRTSAGTSVGSTVVAAPVGGDVRVGKESAAGDDSPRLTANTVPTTTIVIAILIAPNTKRDCWLLLRDVGGDADNGILGSEAGADGGVGVGEVLVPVRWIFGTGVADGVPGSAL